MIDVGVAVTWIAISAASAKGLAMLARAAVTDAEADFASLTGENIHTHDGYSIDPLRRSPGKRP